MSTAARILRRPESGNSQRLFDSQSSSGLSSRDDWTPKNAMRVEREEPKHGRGRIMILGQEIVDV